jgi:biotin synthase-related radical SAM superfamily protein
MGKTASSINEIPWTTCGCLTNRPFLHNDIIREKLRKNNIVKGY